MADVFDLAAYILDRTGPLTAAKLQKLVYYCQAWSLVWDERPIFPERIEAWASGPVVPDLFQAHKGKFEIGPQDLVQGSPENLSSDEIDTVLAVLEHYGDKSAQWLVDLTHMEEPWKEARGHCGPGEKCSNEVTHGSMAEYYLGLVSEQKK